MIKLEHTDIHGWEAAIRGMRNALESWDRSDSDFAEYSGSLIKIGENDLKLMKKLSKAGDDHGKFLRFIDVTVDITAPLYWWKEFDTYKVGTVANSCSTMHKIHAKEFTLEDFSCEHLLFPVEQLFPTIQILNGWRSRYLETKDKKYWWQMIQLLPTNYNQRRTIKLNYQVLKHMYHARKHHKLDEWRKVCEWIESLPYFKEICIDE